MAACNGQIGEAGGGDPLVDPDDPAYCALVPRTPGSVTMRRLNRTEYDNTVRDLLGTAMRPAAATFPNDIESGDGFDNNGTVLTLDNLLMEKYDAAARALAAEALGPSSGVRARYMDCDRASTGDDACARDFIERFGAAAYRRPLLAEDVTRLLAIYDGARAEGESWDAAIELTTRAMLLSPRFLYRVELGGGSAEPMPLDDYELASRLSYFLWSSMPDDELFALAEAGQLQDADQLRAEVDRMLADGKADAFYESFVGQWLHLRHFEHSTPDAEMFPEFDEELRAAMRTETILFVRDAVESGAPLASLLTARHTFLNERLARHYGIDGVTGPDFVRVELDETRGGLFRLGSVLTVTSQPDRTSPVKRGKWVLDQILCEPPPDPPPDVDTFFETEETEALTLRERLARHRADPACAVCHDSIDPLGLSLENYDAIGRYRTLDNDQDIDASGQLPDGRTFDGPGELSDLLDEDERYTTCVTEKVVAYALGRSLDAPDRCFIEDIITRASESDLALREIVIQTVLADTFRATGGRVEEAP
jgi:hypothetical protein